MKIAFTKMHGCGNDFVVVDWRNTKSTPPWKELAPKLLDRRFGVGGDQLLVLLPSETADIKMRIFERDGLETEMCGNGIRCAAHFLTEHGLVKNKISFETLGGQKIVEVESSQRIRVDMGEPTFLQEFWGKTLDLDGKSVRLYPLSMGNPHAVIFLNSKDHLGWVTKLGPQIEKHSWFPKRTNVEFVWVRDPHNVEARVWERSAGETLACGTGACALAVAAIKERRAQSVVKVHLAGGTLEIAWKPGESVFMTGPSANVFTSEIDV